MKKKRKIFVSIICILLAILMALSLILMVVPARAVTQSDIDKLQDELEDLEAQRVAQAELVDTLTANRSLIIERKTALDMQITINRQEIAVLEEELELYDSLLQEKQTQLTNAQAAEDYQYSMLRARMRAMEENGQLGYYAYLFDASSLSDMLSRVADVSDIMHYDSNLEQSLQAARLEVEANAAELEELMDEHDAIRDELEKREAELSAKQSAACNLIANLEGLSDNAQAEYDAIYKAEEEALQEQLKAIAALSAQHAAAVQTYVASTASDSGAASGSSQPASVDLSSLISSSGLRWPLDSTYITSTYGYRVSPTAGASSNHQAIDIDGNTGDRIYAAANGTVIASTYNGGLGYYVTIQHDDGTISTRYAHMSQTAVSVGDSVSAGQVIGYVGATGIATGDHLDYAVYVNGQAVDPLSFYNGSGLAYDPSA